MKNTRKKSHISFLLISSTILLFFFFFLMLGNPVSAEAGNMKEMKSYESILVKEGDTLSSVAATYANVYSCFSKEESHDQQKIDSDCRPRCCGCLGFLHQSFHCVQAD